MLRKISIPGFLLLLIATLVYAAGSIVNVTVDKKDKVLRVAVSVDNEGAWLGCSINTPYGRKDKQAVFVTGEDTKTFAYPSTATSYEVALWRETWNYGDPKGPDPYNAWGKINGYYLWNELDRKEGSL